MPTLVSRISSIPATNCALTRRATSHATDPGWTPVFLIIRGIVTETGGVLSHAACLSREYGLPAVQVPGAIQRIPDGATITVLGDTGEVVIEDAGPAEPANATTVEADTRR